MESVGLPLLYKGIILAILRESGNTHLEIISYINFVRIGEKVGLMVFNNFCDIWSRSVEFLFENLSMTFCVSSSEVLLRSLDLPILLGINLSKSLAE